MIRLEDKLPAVVVHGEEIANKSLQALLYSLPDGAIIRMPDEGMRLVLDDTLVWSNRGHQQIRSRHRPGTWNTGAPVIQYVGKAGGTVLAMERVKRPKLVGIEFAPGDADTVIDLDGYEPGNIGTEATIKGCFIPNDAGRDTFCAVSIAKAARQNQEFHRLINVTVSGGGKGTAVRNTSAQAKAIVIKRGTYENLATAFDMQLGGFHLSRVNFTNNELDLFAGDCQDASSDSKSTSEHSRRHLHFPGAGSLTVSKGRFGIENTPLGGGYIKYGVNVCLTMIGNTFDQPAPAGTTLFEGMTFRGLTLIGNHYSGSGMTLAQLGLAFGAGAWEIINERIKGAPRYATRLSSSTRDGVTKVLSSMMFAGGTDPEAMITSVRELTPTFPSGPTIAARSEEWRTYTVPGLNVTDRVLSVTSPANNPVGLGGWAVAGKERLALHWLNPRAATRDPAAGVYRVLVMGIA